MHSGTLKDHHNLDPNANEANQLKAGKLCNRKPNSTFLLKNLLKIAQINYFFYYFTP